MGSGRRSLVLHSAVALAMAATCWSTQARAANITAVVDSPSNIQVKLGQIVDIGGTLTPIDAATIPGDGHLYVGTYSPGSAQILAVDPVTKTTAATPFLNLATVLGSTITGQGLQGITFSPNYNDPNSPGYHKFYTYEEEKAPANPASNVMYLHPEVPNPADVGVIREWTANAAGTAIDTTKASRVVFNFGTPAGHMGGGMKFGPDGYLYLATGDGGGNGDGNGTTSTTDGFTGRDTGVAATSVPGISNGQDFTNALGKVLRIDPYTTNFTGTVGTARTTVAGETAKFLPGASSPSYYIPNSNPFVGDPQNIYFDPTGPGTVANPTTPTAPIPELFAFGFRNPFKLSFDKDALPGDAPYVGNVGSHEREEIEHVVGGKNYGWPYVEGDVNPAPAAAGRPVNAQGLLPFLQFNAATNSYVQYTQDPTLVNPALMTGPMARMGTRSGTGSPLTFVDHTIGDTGDGDAVVGGFVYRGTLIPQLEGMYVFGMYEYLITDTTRAASTFPAVSAGGRLLYFDPNEASDIKTVKEFNYDPGFGLSNTAPNAGFDLMGVVQGDDGELYAMFANGDIQEILPSAVPEPASLALLGTSALLLLKRRRR